MLCTFFIHGSQLNSPSSVHVLVNEENVIMIRYFHFSAHCDCDDRWAFHKVQEVHNTHGQETSRIWYRGEVTLIYKFKFNLYSRRFYITQLHNMFKHANLHRNLFDIAWVGLYDVSCIGMNDMFNAEDLVQAFFKTIYIL